MGKPNDAEGFIRITTDPTVSRIISAGMTQLSNTVDNIANSRFIPLK